MERRGSAGVGGAGVRASGGGGVRDSTWGRSGSAVGGDGELARPLAWEGAVGVPWARGVESADRPRMMPSSTSRFFASIAFFRVAKLSCWDSSSARMLRFVWMIFSRPVIRARRALMDSETAPSALARFLTRALRRAACTGGVGVGLLGSVSFSYSESAVGTAEVVEAVALETAIWRDTRGWISGGAEGPEELENREPPIRGFFLPALSMSRCMLAEGFGVWIDSFGSHRQCGLLSHPGLRAQRSAAASTPRPRVEVWFVPLGQQT